MMKRLLILFAAVLPLVAGCQKPQPVADAPSIVWESNPSFVEKEMTADLDAVVTLNAPAGMDALTLTLGLGNYALLANPYVKIAANKGSLTKAPVFDVIDDDSVAGLFSGLGLTAGSVLRGREQVKIDFLKLLETILEGQPVENDTSFYMEIRLVDSAGNGAVRMVRFHYTIGPVFTWKNNPDFAVVNLNDAAVNTRISISAPGCIEKLSIRLEEGCAPQLASYVKNRTTEQSMVIDLVEDARVAETFKGYFPSGAAVVNKTDVTLDFSFIYGIKYDLSASTNVFTVTAVDNFGKESSAQVKFKI